MKKIISLTLIGLIFSCSSDNGSNPDPNDDDTGGTILEDIIDAFTSGSERTWFIQSATLTNDNVDNLNVTSAFNIKDDEFVFTSNNLDVLLEWRKKNSINANASVFNEVLVDYLRSPENAILSFNDTTNDTFSDGLNKFSISYVNDNQLQGVIDYGNNSSLSFTLVPKTISDYKSVPTAALNFQEVYTYEGQLSIHLGFNIAKSKDRFYIAQKLVPDNNVPLASHKLIEYDLSNGNVVEQISTELSGGFNAKRINIVNDKVWVFDSAVLASFSLDDIQDDPTYTSLNSSIFLAEAVTIDDKIYVIGGDGANAGEDSDNIYLYSASTNQFTFEVEMPDRRFDGDGAIVNNKLYVFGGYPIGGDAIGNDAIFIYDLESGEQNTSLTLPKVVSDTFVSTYDNLIFVGGRRYIDAQGNNDNPASEERESFLGVFNTLDNTFTELDVPFDDSNQNVLMNLSVHDDKLYVVHGGPDGSGQRIFKVYVSDLN